jgi:hypothetical protein
VVIASTPAPCRDGRQRLSLCPRGLYGAPSWDSNCPANGRHTTLISQPQNQDARTLLRPVVQWPLDEQVRERIAAAAFLEWAVRLSLDPEPRARRALAAAQAKYLAGAPDAARGHSASVPTLERAVRRLRGPGATQEEQLRWLWPGRPG